MALDVYTGREQVVSYTMVRKRDVLRCAGLDGTGRKVASYYYSIPAGEALSDAEQRAYLVIARRWGNQIVPA